MRRDFRPTTADGSGPKQRSSLPPRPASASIPYFFSSGARKDTTTNTSSQHRSGSTTPLGSSTNNVYTTRSLQQESFSLAAQYRQDALLNTLHMTEDDLLRHPVYRDTMLKRQVQAERSASAGGSRPSTRPATASGRVGLGNNTTTAGDAALQEIYSRPSTAAATREGALKSLATRPQSAQSNYSTVSTSKLYVGGSRPGSAAVTGAHRHSTPNSSALGPQIPEPVASVRANTTGYYKVPSVDLVQARKQQADRDALRHLQNLVASAGSVPTVEDLRGMLRGDYALESGNSPDRSSPVCCEESAILKEEAAALADAVIAGATEEPVTPEMGQGDAVQSPGKEVDPTATGLDQEQGMAEDRVFSAKQRLQEFLDHLFNVHLNDFPALGTFVKSIASEYDRYIQVILDQSGVSSAEMLRRTMLSAAQELRGTNAKLAESEANNRDLTKMLDKMRDANEDHAKSRTELEGYVDELRTCLSAQTNKILTDAKGEALLPDDPSVGPYTKAVKRMAREIETLRVENKRLSELGTQQVEAFEEQSEELIALLVRANDFQKQTGNLKGTLRVMKAYIDQLEQRVKEISTTYVDRTSFCFSQLQHEAEQELAATRDATITSCIQHHSAQYRNMVPLLHPNLGYNPANVSASEAGRASLSAPDQGCTLKILQTAGIRVEKTSGAAKQGGRRPSIPGSNSKTAAEGPHAVGAGPLLASLLPKSFKGDLMTGILKAKFKPLALSEVLGATYLGDILGKVSTHGAQINEALSTHVTKGTLGGGSAPVSHDLDKFASLCDFSPQGFLVEYYRAKYRGSSAAILTRFDVVFSLEQATHQFHKRSLDCFMYQGLSHGWLPLNFATTLVPTVLQRLRSRMQKLEPASKKFKDKVPKASIYRTLQEVFGLPPGGDAPPGATAAPTNEEVHAGVQQAIDMLMVVISLSQESKSPLEELSYEAWFDRLNAPATQVYDAIVRAIAYCMKCVQQSLARALIAKAKGNYSARSADILGDFGFDVKSEPQQQAHRPLSAGITRDEDSAGEESPQKKNLGRSAADPTPFPDVLDGTRRFGSRKKTAKDKTAAPFSNPCAARPVTDLIEEKGDGEEKGGSLFRVLGFAEDPDNPQARSVERMLAATTLRDDAVGLVSCFDVAKVLLAADPNVTCADFRNRLALLTRSVRLGRGCLNDVNIKAEVSVALKEAALAEKGDAEESAEAESAPVVVNPAALQAAMAAAIVTEPVLSSHFLESYCIPLEGVLKNLREVCPLFPSQQPQQNQ